MESQLQGNLDLEIDGFVDAEGSRNMMHIDQQENGGEDLAAQWVQFQLKEATSQNQLPLLLPPVFGSEATVLVNPNARLEGAVASCFSSSAYQQGKKRFLERPTERRQKRMIKNRESAARSRARRQAYTNELEIEVAQLIEENAKLRMQIDSESLIPECHSEKKKNILRRTLTAPF